MNECARAAGKLARYEHIGCRLWPHRRGWPFHSGSIAIAGSALGSSSASCPWSMVWSGIPWLEGARAWAPRAKGPEHSTQDSGLRHEALASLGWGSGWFEGGADVGGTALSRRRVPRWRARQPPQANTAGTRPVAALILVPRPRAPGSRASKSWLPDRIGSRHEVGRDPVRFARPGGGRRRAVLGARPAVDLARAAVRTPAVPTPAVGSAALGTPAVPSGAISAGWNAARSA